MPKKYRLTHADFVRLEKVKSQRLHGAFFSLGVSPLLEGEGPKMASIVSKQVSVRAVERNRIERQCREVLRPYLFAMNQSVALILRAKREAAEATNAELQGDIQTLMKRVGLAHGA